MALRRCDRFAVVVPRLLWNRSVLPGTGVPGDRSPVWDTVSAHPTCGSECRHFAVSSLLGSSAPARLLRVHAQLAVDQVHLAKELLLRTFSSTPPGTDVSYEQLKQLLAAQKAVVIDVREPWELREYGFIPGAINVPLGQVNTALQLCPGEFREKYGGEMPQQTDNVVFTCLAGVRSRSALDQAALLGYKE